MDLARANGVAFCHALPPRVFGGAWVSGPHNPRPLLSHSPRLRTAATYLKWERRGDPVCSGSGGRGRSPPEFRIVPVTSSPFFCDEIENSRIGEHAGGQNQGTWPRIRHLSVPLNASMCPMAQSLPKVRRFAQVLIPNHITSLQKLRYERTGTMSQSSGSGRGRSSGHPRDRPFSPISARPSRCSVAENGREGDRGYEGNPPNLLHNRMLGGRPSSVWPTSS